MISGGCSVATADSLKDRSNLSSPQPVGSFRVNHHAHHSRSNREPDQLRSTARDVEVVGMGLSRTEHQGNFGESFVHVLASAAGLTVAKEDLDTRGFDFTIGYKGTLGRLRHPNIQVQIKSWSEQYTVMGDGSWKYKLKAKYFNELAGPDFQVPRFLVLVVVPDDWREYAKYSRECAQLRQAAYWVSLRHRPVSQLTPDSKVAVDVPLANLLTPQTLHELLMPAATVQLEA